MITGTDAQAMLTKRKFEGKWGLNSIHIFSIFQIIAPNKD